MGTTATADRQPPTGTRFVRCADCGTPYHVGMTLPHHGLTDELGHAIPNPNARPFWRRPEPKALTAAERNALPLRLGSTCHHRGDAEWWDGTRWVLITFTEGIRTDG